MKTLNGAITKNRDKTMLDGWGKRKEGGKSVKIINQ